VKLGKIAARSKSPSSFTAHPGAANWASSPLGVIGIMFAVANSSKAEAAIAGALTSIALFPASPYSEVNIMRTATWFFLVGTGLALGAEPVRLDPTQDDAARLQGAWAIDSVEVEGNPFAMEKLSDARLFVHGQRYSFRFNGIELEMTYRLDAALTPKAIDLIVTDGPNKGKMFRGIYKLEDDRFTICRTTEPEEDRPTTFSTRRNSGLITVVWKRAIVTAWK
jgi:uncharacterized protein (TIGR03067 family)